MRLTVFLPVLAATLAASPVQALFGLGVHYGRNFSSVNAQNATITATDALPQYFRELAAANGGSPTLRLQAEEVSGLQTLGVKAWLNLPLLPVEFEATGNISWGSYFSSIVYTDLSGDTVRVPTNIDAPIGLVPGIDGGETPYVLATGDLSVRYPFLKLPPVAPIKILRVYVGGGVSWVYATRTVNESDLREFFDVAAAGVPLTEEQLSDRLSDNLTAHTVGGHLLVGAQFKLPIIPIALYTDAKWYFNAATSEAAGGNPFQVHVGAAFAL